MSIEAGNGEIFNAIINSFNNISANNITVDGLVDGRDIAADGSKLDGIELGATADQTASEILTAIKTVDGAGSGLDADLLDGQEGTYYLDYDNFTNTPTDTDILNQIKTVDGAGSGLDADLLDGQEGTYYLDYDNFTNTPTASDILTAIKTVYGTGSGLDADLLDGYTNQDFFDNANNVVTSFVSNAEITITAGDALTGGGIFGLNQTASLEITINHDDTSSVANVNNSNGTGLQDITFDTFGHVQTIGSVDLDGRYYTETESDAKYVLQTTQVIAGTALTGGGALSSNVTINHGDTSSASSVNNSNGTVIQDITIDTHGHVTALGSANLDDRYYTETELDAGQLDNRYYTETELDVFLSGKVDNTVNILAGSGLSGGGPLTANVTISHADTSSQANTSLSGSEFITTLNLDTFGHVVGVTKETRNFLTEADADLRYVNIDGDTMTGDLTVQANIIQDHAAYVTATATTTTIFGTQIWSFDSAIYNSAEVIITMTQGINRHITKLLIVHNGSTAAATEFGTIYTNTSLASFDVGLSGGNVTLTATPSNATSTVYKIAATLIID